MRADNPHILTDRQNSGCMSRLHLQNNGMRGNRSAGRGRMSSATSMYRMSLVNRSWFSNVTPWDSSRAVGMEEASLGMSEMSKVGTHDRASGLSGVSCTTKKRHHALLQLQPVSTEQHQLLCSCMGDVLEIARTLCCNISFYVAVWVMSWRLREHCAAADSFRAAHSQSLQHMIQHFLGKKTVTFLLCHQLSLMTR